MLHFVVTCAPPHNSVHRREISLDDAPVELLARATFVVGRVWLANDLAENPYWKMRNVQLTPTGATCEFHREGMATISADCIYITIEGDLDVRGPW